MNETPETRSVLETSGQTAVCGEVDASRSIIRLKGLTKSFGEKAVLRGIDLDVAPGEILGYIGPNGAGKTTTVKILIGMLDDFGGEARVCGYNVATHPLEVKRRIGYVPESAALYEQLTPLEFLRFVGRIHGLDAATLEARARELLTLFELGFVLDERMITFSKGMRQKVLVTAALLHAPDVIFMDEPLSGLDANAAVTVKEILCRLARAGKTIFYCSHVMDVVERVCDRIVILAEGRIAANGSFDSLRAMDKEASLESIFMQLTSDGGYAEVAERYVRALMPEPAHE